MEDRVDPVGSDEQRIAELSRAAEMLIAGPPEYLRAFVGEDETATVG